MRSKKEIKEEIQRLQAEREGLLDSKGSPYPAKALQVDNLEEKIEKLKSELVEAEGSGDEKARNIIKKHLDKAAECANQNHFVDAFTESNEAEKYLRQNPQFETLVKKTKAEQVEKPWRKWKTSLETKIEAGLVAKNLPSDIDRWITEYHLEAARPFPKDLAKRERNDVDAKVSKWLEVLKHVRDAAAANRAEKELRKKLEALWKEASEQAEAGKNVEAKTLARQALGHAEVEQKNFPDHPGIRDLVDEAKSIDNKYKVGLRTEWATGNFEALYWEYVNSPKDKFPELPIYSPRIVAGRLQFILESGSEWLALEVDEKLVPRGVAITELALVAIQYAVDKADEKRRLAEAARKDHNPLGALKLLNDVEEEGNVKLFLPPGKEKEKDWLEQLKAVRECRRIVASEVKIRKQAEKIRNEVYIKPDVKEGWEDLRRAAELDAYVPQIFEARTQLLSGFRLFIERKYGEVEEERKRGHWAGARTIAEDLRKLTRDDDRLQDWTNKLDTTIKACEDAERDEAAVLAEIKDIKAELDKGEKCDLNEADQRLALLEKRVGIDKRAYPDIDILRGRIDARKNIRRAITEAEKVLKAPNSTQDMLQVKIEVLDEFKDDPDVERLIERLQARWNFRNAEKERRLIADFDDYQAVRREYQSVIDLEGDDTAQAQKAIEALDQSLVDAEKIAQVVRAARQLNQRGNFKEAYDMLEPWSKEAGVLSIEVAKTRQKSLDGLAGRLIGEMEAQCANPDIRLVEAKINALSHLEEQGASAGEKNARYWEGDLLAKCYAQRAKAARNKFEALPDWIRAYELAFSETKLWRTVRTNLDEAAKAKVFVEIAQAEDDEAIAKLREMITGYAPDPVNHPQLILSFSEDAEVRVRLARCLIARQEEKQHDFDNAQREIKAAKELLESQSNRKVSSELGTVQGRIDQEDAIRREREFIEKQLKPSGDVENFGIAVNRAKKLINKYSDRRTELESWWDELVEETIENLVDELNKTTEALWKRINLVLKIRELQPTHGKAKAAMLEMAGDALLLQGKVYQMQQNTTGPSEPRARDALGEHIKEVSELWQEARAYQLMFRRYNKELEKDKPSTLDEDEKSIRERKGALQALSSQIADTYQVLAQAKRSGEGKDWERVDSLIGEMSGTFDLEYPERGRATSVRPYHSVTFRNHRTLAALKEDIDHGKQKRAQLEDARSKLKEAWKNEDFDSVLEIITMMKVVDPDDSEYGIRETVFIPVEKETSESIETIERLAIERRDQLTKIQKWADAMALVVPWGSPPIVHMDDSTQISSSSEEYERVVEMLEQIDVEVKNGNHAQAGELYTTLPEKQSPPPKSGSSEKQLTTKIAQNVEMRIRQAEFAEALLLSFIAMIGKFVDKPLRDLFGEETTKANFENKGRVGLRSLLKDTKDGMTPQEKIVKLSQAWQEKNAMIVGEEVTDYPFRPGQPSWSLKKALSHFEDLPIKTEEHIFSKKARLALARGIVHATTVRQWASEANICLQPKQPVKDEGEATPKLFSFPGSITAANQDYEEHKKAFYIFYDEALKIRNKFFKLGGLIDRRGLENQFSSCMFELRAAASVCPREKCTSIDNAYKELEELDKKLYKRLSII